VLSDRKLTLQTFDFAPHLFSLSSSPFFLPFLDHLRRFSLLALDPRQLRDSVSAYEQLLASAKAYRNALIALSSASTGLAGALETCSRVKGAGESAENLMAASGLHYMVSSSSSVLVSSPSLGCFEETLIRDREVRAIHCTEALRFRSCTLTISTLRISLRDMSSTKRYFPTRLQRLDKLKQRTYG